MANLGEAFDPSTTEKRSFEKLPTGWYPAHITESDVRETKNGKGLGANFKFEVLEGDHAKRSLFSWFNIKHDTAEAEKIGRQQLGELCDAIGHKGPLTDSEALHFKPVMIKVGVRKDDPDQNEIKGFKPYGAAAAAPGAPQPAGGRPWGRKAA